MYCKREKFVTIGSNEYAIDPDYHYCECFIDENHRFNYYYTEYGKLLDSTSVLMKISKSIPNCFHRMILYYKYIPKLL
jgi:hypothetical protein